MNATTTLAAAAGETWDAVVIGAGPAGALAAHGLAKQGLRVLLVDARAFPRSKVCGGCLNLNSLSTLRSAGLTEVIEVLQPVSLGEFRLAAGGRQVSVSLPGGWAVSRRAMDVALIGAAVAAGAEFLPETTAMVGEVEGDRRSVTLDAHGQSESTAARVVVAACGLGARCLAKLEGFGTRESPDSRIGVESLLSDFPEFYEPGVIFMAVGEGGYVGLTRVENGQLNVAAAVDRKRMKGAGSPAEVCQEILQEAGFPLNSGMRAAEWRGTIGLTRRADRRAGERLFLVGDAAGYVEPFTGEGMAWALASGQRVVPFVREGLAEWRPEVANRWEQLYRDLIERRQWLCRALASGLRRKRLIRIVIPCLSKMPWLARPIVRRLNQEPENVVVDSGIGNRAASAQNDAGGGPGDVQQHHLPG